MSLSSIDKPNFIHTQNTISKWMTNDPVTLLTTQTIEEAISQFSQYNFYGVPVVDEHGYIEGMLTKSSIMTALYQNISFAQPITSIMDTAFDAVFPLDPLKKAVHMREGCLPVITDDRKLVGIITRTDLLKAHSIQFDTMHSSLDTMSVLQQVLDNAYEGVVVVDKKGYITEINDAYCQILNKEKQEVLNQPVENIIDNTRLHIICQTGKEERNQIQRINGHEMIVHRIPLYKNNQIIGATGLLIYQNIDEMFSLANQLSLDFLQPEQSQQLRQDFYLNQLIGQSAMSLKLKEKMSKMARLPSNVLITGESGTGKERYASTIHQLSLVSKGPFIAINCSAIPENLLESELFGYAEGAFTGALKGGKKGKFELAENGTIFLDEIGDMPLVMQAKLLRVLQEKRIEPVGATFSKKINVRIIAATNQDLEKKVADKTFREDLYYRLNVLRLQLPSLRENRSDIPPLIQYYLHTFAKEFHRPIPKVTEQAQQYLYQYDYPGNIRELANICEALVGLCENHVITTADLPKKITEQTTLIQENQGQLATWKEQLEKEKIRQALELYQDNKSKTAKHLGIQRSTLYQKMKKYHLE